MSFQLALEHMLQFEGGYANDPADSGGETFRGISRKNWPKWAGWPAIDLAKSLGHNTRRAIDAQFEDNPQMAADVAAFYRANFWDPWARHDLPSRLTEKLFDTAVNMGQSRAAKLLQRAVNDLGTVVKLAVDGAIGPRTLDAVEVILGALNGEARLLAAYCGAQADHYRAIARAKPSQAKFLKGWLRRAAWVPE